MLGIHKNVHFARNGTSEIGFEVFLPPSLLVDGVRRDAIKHTLNVLLSRALPVGARGRFIVDNADLEEWELRRCTLAVPQDASVLSEVIEADNASLTRARKAGELKVLRYYLLVKLDRKIPKGRSLSERERDLMTDYANAFANRLGTALDAAGWSPLRMQSQDIADLIYKYRNRQFGRMAKPFRSVVPTGALGARELQGNPNHDLPSPRRQMSESSVDKSNPGFLVVGSHLVNVVSWTEIEDGGTQSGMLEHLLTVMREVDFFLMIDFVMVNPTTKKAALSYKAEGAKNSIEDGGGSANQAINDEMQEALYNLTRGHDKMVLFGVAMVIYAKTIEQLHDSTRRARTEMGQVGGAIARIGNVENIKQYELLEPFNGQNNQYLFDGRTLNVAALIPQVGSWIGTEDPLVVFRNRQGGLTPINQAVGTNNSGTFILGGAGSGKSNLNMTMLLNVCALKGRVYILDLKEDYKTLVQAVEGEVITIRPGAKLPNGDHVRINMFDLPVGEVRPSSDKRNLLMGMFKAMLMSSGGLGPLDYTILTSAIESAYALAVGSIPGMEELTEYYKPFYLSDFVRIMRNLPTVAGVAPDDTMQQAIKTLAARLGAFTGNSPLGPFMDGPTTVRVQADVTCFDISAMREESARELRRIGMILLVDLIWRSGLESPGVIKYPVFEELGAMAEIEEAATFVANMFKVGRSAGFWPVAITQEIGDLMKVKGIINNSALRLIGNVSEEEAEEIVKALKLSPATHDAINSLGGGRDFREYVALLELSSGVLVGDVIQNHLHPFKYWLTTTKQEDTTRLAAYAERLGGNRVAAAKALAGIVAA
ncbi:DUF87 domain-containing protein [Deinococcus sp. HMF7604]|nr:MULTISPECIES: DUF87 domain-containing protein [Deinococcus]MBZ9752198.1 DUF87 domain-containing protein [Deinococcus betulae]